MSEELKNEELNLEESSENEEYVTFTVKSKDGEDVELAVVDEFDFEKKHYVAAAMVVGDEISDEGVYIYKSIITEDDVKFEKIRNAIDYQKVVDAYMAMIEEEE